MDAVIPPFSTPVSPAFAAAAAPEAGDVADHPVPRQPISTDTAAPAQSTDAPVTPSHKRQRSPGTHVEGSDKAPSQVGAELHLTVWDRLQYPFDQQGSNNNNNNNNNITR